MKFKVITFFLLSCLIAAFPFVQGQNANVRYQEILAEVANEPSNEKKITILTNGSYELRRKTPRKALSLSSRAVIVADQHGILQGPAYTSKGARQINIEYYEGAILSYTKALAFNKGADKAASRAKNHKSLGHCFEQLLDYENSLVNYQKSLDLYKGLKNQKEAAAILNKLGLIHFEQKDYQKALNSFEESLSFVRKMGGSAEDIKKLQNNIAQCKSRLGSTSASPTASRGIQALGFEEQYEIIRDSLSEVTQQLRVQEEELLKKIAEISGKDTTIAANMQRIDILQDYNESLAREKQQQEREFILYLIIAIGTAGTILMIALLIYRNSRLRKKANLDLAEKNDQLSIEKQKSDDLLLNILPGSVAEELKATGKVTPKVYKHATMLFTDFKGFTRLASSMSPDALITELDRCFEAFDDICDRYNLEKIKTIGDAYMAVAGVPDISTTHVVDTVRAALEMQAFMASWQKEKIAEGKPYWELRIGIHTGSVIAGVIGKHKFVYDIWGDAVNIASRMESAGEEWKVNVSDQTYLLIKDKFDCTHRGKVPIKHKGPVDMYFVNKEK